MTKICVVPATAGVYAGLRAAGKKADLSLIVADKPATAAGTFTLNVMCAAPVLYCKDVLARQDKVTAVRYTAVVYSTKSCMLDSHVMQLYVCLSAYQCNCSDLQPQSTLASAV